VTVGIFAFAFLADGLSTRVRTRSVTELDQTTGQVVSWARHSYYSGIAPKSGMEFSTETIVLPIFVEPLQNYYDSSNNEYFQTQWGKKQYLKGDWLLSRNLTQYLTVRSTQAPAAQKLAVQASSKGITVTNQLGVPIRQLLVIGTDGKAYWGEQISANDQRQLSEVKSSTAIDKLRASLDGETPEFPPGLHSGGAYNSYGSYHYSYSHSSMVITTEDSLLEQKVRQVSQLMAMDPNSPFKPGRYLAILEDSPFVENGVKDAQQQSSLHLLSGRWK